MTLDAVTMASKIADACNSQMLHEDDVTTKASLVPSVRPLTRWRRFDHDGTNGNGYPVSENFSDYPKLRGWAIEQVWNEGDLRKAHARFQDDRISNTEVVEHVVAMLQSWLYFGFLEAFTRKRIHTSYFTTFDEEGLPVLHSGYLGFVFFACKLSLEGSLEELLDATWEIQLSVASIVQLLYLWTDPGTTHAVRIEKNFPGFAEAVIDILPSVVRLFDAISLVRDDVASDSGRRIVVLRGPRHTTAQRDQRLLQRGWCPFLLRFCKDSLHDSVLDWLDGTQRNSVTAGHERCSEMECARNNIDPTTYRTIHIHEGCPCTSIQPDVEQVLSIIDQGQIPVILPGEESNLDVQAHDPSSDGNYIAISHVWVDGLGSVTEKGLPKCQVEKLTHLVQDASGPGPTPFWIDSLCIPQAVEQRKKSIALLRDVYQRASSVLVIDKTISTCSSGDDTPIEDLLWAITSSSWAQRLLTYQESYLARRLHLSTANEKLVTWDLDFPYSRILSTLRILYTSFEQHLRSLRPPDTQHGTERKTNIGQVASALNWRSTSRKADETLAVAALLLVDTRKLVDTPADPPAERMKQLYLLAVDMPSDIIFFDGPNMVDPPFRWAPESLMARSATMLDVAGEAHTSRCMSDGLHGDYLALMIVEPLVGAKGNTLFVQGPDEHPFPYGIFWSPEFAQNPPEVVFNAVIVREVDDETYLKPDIGTVVEGVAVRTGSRSSAGLVCDWAGRVTLLKYDPDDIAVPKDNAHSGARWEKLSLVIR